ncbi:MAG: hypothetical protein PF440_07860 [Thiomicrorhabdus sp.]|jgi:hypothetical protein|nr:hypothetical protein [Thiomicrorhabdus sp.]
MIKRGNTYTILPQNDNSFTQSTVYKNEDTNERAVYEILYKNGAISVSITTNMDKIDLEACLDGTNDFNTGDFDSWELEDAFGEEEADINMNSDLAEEWDDMTEDEKDEFWHITTWLTDEKGFELVNTIFEIEDGIKLDD